MAELASLFPRELAENIRDGLKHGVSDQQMVKGMVSMGNLMSRFVQPDSPEEALMAEMWKLSTDEEKRMMAEIILRLAKKHLH